MIWSQLPNIKDNFIFLVLINELLEMFLFPSHMDLRSESCSFSVPLSSYYANDPQKNAVQGWQNLSEIGQLQMLHQVAFPASHKDYGTPWCNLDVCWIYKKYEDDGWTAQLKWHPLLFVACMGHGFYHTTMAINLFFWRGRELMPLSLNPIYTQILRYLPSDKVNNFKSVAGNN